MAVKCWAIRETSYVNLCLPRVNKGILLVMLSQTYKLTKRPAKGFIFSYNQYQMNVYLVNNVPINNI